MEKKVPTPIVPYSPLEWSEIKVPKFRDAGRAWKFLKKHGFRRLPHNVELVFLKDLNMAVDYAQRVNSRLPLVFENEIKKFPQISYEYISRVIRAPLEEFEETLSQVPHLLVKYSSEILQGPLPEHLENKLVGDPYSCFEYAWQVLDGRLPETLHNFMFCANMDTTNFGRKYRGGYHHKLHDAEEYNPDYVSPQIYFDFIKWQRKNLHRQISHYQKIYGIDGAKTVGEFLFELEYGR